MSRLRALLRFFRLAPLGLTLVAPGCRSGSESPGPAAGPPPPVVLISIDTLRSDRLPAWSGRTDLATPAIDRLVHDGLLFEHAFAEVPLTLPSHVSIFTGQLPPTHGVRDNIGFTVDDKRTALLQQRLRERGYATGAAVSAEVLAKRTGIAAGFDLFDEPAPFASRGAAARTAERAGGLTVAAATRFLDAIRTPGTRPFFLFLHLYEPHAPYRPPEPWRARFRDPYDGEIATVDALVGGFLVELDRRRLYDPALILLLSDHGEGLGDHGEDEHGLLLYREELQVPLVVKLPGARRAGERVARNVALIDIVPTVLDLLHLPADATLPGISLLSAAPPADRAIYSETMYPLIHFGWSELASIVTGDLHLIDGLRPEIFDFKQDPGERHDRTDHERRSLAAMRRSLAAIDRKLLPPAPADAETIAALGALGYLGTAAPDQDRATLADPRDKVAGIAPVLRGMRFFNEGDYRAAIDVLRPVTRGKEGADGSALAWQYLGASYDALGRKADALAAYRQGMRLAGSSSYLAETAALRLLELGRPQAAADLVAQELDRHPESGRLRVLASRALLQLGRIDDAARAANDAVARDAGMADAYYQRAVVALARQNGLAAIDDLVTAARLDGRHVEARKALAMLRHAQGDDAEAQRLLGEALAIDPDDRDAREDLATLTAAGPSSPR